MNNDLAAIQQDQAAVAADIQALVNPTPAPSKSCRTVLFDAAKRIAAYREGVAALDKKYNLGGQLWAIHVAAIAGLAQVGASAVRPPWPSCSTTPRPAAAWARSIGRRC